MRLWSLHPKYLDPQGLVALWREGLLAQAVLSGETKGYRSHPQLARFRAAPDPAAAIAAYLRGVHVEAVRRGYRFDGSKIRGGGDVAALPVTEGQLAYEWEHLQRKLRQRSPAWFGSLPDVTLPEPHPLFFVVEGEVAPWEIRR